MNKIIDITDALIDGTYLAASMVDYTACCATTTIAAAQSLRARFYQIDELPLAFLEIVTFITYSFIAKYYKGANKDTLHWFINFMVISWPYFRDFISGLKNGRHAVVNIGFLLNPSATHLMYSFTNPIGIIIGALLAFNLIWYRNMSDNRKQGTAANEKLACLIKSHSKIYRHSIPQRIINFLASGFDGLTDGMYLYGCLFVVISLGLTPSPGSPLLILALVVISVITLAAFISKVHDEYLSQQELKVSELKCELALLDANSEHGQKKITSLKQQIKSLTIPTDPDSLTFIGKLTFFTFRGGLSGAKNAIAAIDSIRDHFNNATATLILGFVKAFTAIAYCLYLGARGMKREFEKRNILDKFLLFKQQEGYTTLGARKLAYTRDNYV